MALSKSTLKQQIAYLNIRFNLAMRVTPQHAGEVKAAQDYMKCASCGHSRKEHPIVKRGWNGKWERLCGCGCTHWEIDRKLYKVPQRAIWVVWYGDAPLLTDANTTEVWHFLSGFTRALDLQFPSGTPRVYENAAHAQHNSGKHKEVSK